MEYLSIGRLDSFRIDMIIVLDFSKQNLDALTEGQASYVFSEIASSSIRGNHFVVCNRSIAGWVLDRPWLGAHVVSHFKKLSQEYTQTASLASSGLPKLELYLGRGLERVDARNTWRCGHETALQGNILNASRLIVEDAEFDGDFWGKCIAFEAKKAGIQSAKFEIINGGGSSTYKGFRTSVEGRYVSVCICDHDMIAPYTSRSMTSRKVEAEAKRQVFVGSVIIPACREVENLIPLAALLDLFSCANKREYLEFQDLIEKQGACKSGDCMWLYFDVKSGINAGMFKNKCKDNKSKDWIMSKFKLSEWEDIEKIYIPGFGDEVAKRAMRDNKTQAELNKLFRSEYWRRHFSDSIASIAWFFAARRVERIQ